MSNSNSVTVVCICYNHEKWIEVALDSVKTQDYSNVNLIVVDNGSQDESPEKIKSWVQKNEKSLPIEVVLLKQSIPYCRLFNEVLESVKSDFVLDLAGDDFLYPEHIAKSIVRLDSDSTAALVFSDAIIQAESGSQTTFYPRSSSGKLLFKVQEGDIYELLIRRSHISAPTVLFRTSTLKSVNGYDESLAYEDFDVHLRLARRYRLLFSDHIGVLKRKHSASMSAAQYKRYSSQMLPSTIKVCRKIKEMNRNQEEDDALKERVCYELKHTLFSANFNSANDLVRLGEELEIKNLRFRLFKIWAKTRVDLSWLYMKIV